MVLDFIGQKVDFLFGLGLWDNTYLPSKKYPIFCISEVRIIILEGGKT